MIKYKIKYKTVLTAVLLALGSVQSFAGTTDLQYPPVSSAGHDFNHAPIGQSFVAVAPQVKAGLFIADEETFTAWLSQTYPGLPPFPYAVAPSVTIRIELLRGEGVSGTVLHSRNLTLTKPFMGFVDVDYAAEGVSLVTGQKYTLLITDISAQSYPNGVTGWVVPAVTDTSSGAPLPPGAYPDGLPILQGALVANDAGIGDNAFEVLDMGGSAPAPLLISGTLPYGLVGQPYSATLTASGGLAPYDWSAVGLPDGVQLNSQDGTIAGIPLSTGSYNSTVTAVDSVGTATNASYTIVISQLSCSKPKTAKSTRGKGIVTAVGAGYLLVGSKRIDYASCTTINYGGYATAPMVGDRVEWQGFIQANGYVMAQILTFN